MSELSQMGSLKGRGPKTMYDRVDNPGRIRIQPTVAKSILLDTWFPEVAAMAFSITCVGVIIGILRTYDQHALPSLPRGITLNAIIAILATGAKSALLAAVASAVGQGKWIWFLDKPRPLAHAQILDEASRGPFGSMAMLVGKTAFSIPALGAMITVLSLAFDPFVQQILSTYVQQVPHPSTLVVTTQATAFLGADPLRFNQALSNGVYTDNFDRTPGCPSGNCTWPSFRSLGWCNKCEDATDQVRDNCTYSYDASTLNQSQHYFGSCNIRLSQGYAANLVWEVVPSGDSGFGLQATTEVIWLVDDGNSTTTATFDNPSFLGVDSPQAVLGHAMMEFDDPTHPEKGFHVANASQCVLSYCVRDYQITVGSGDLSVSLSPPNFGKVYTKDDVDMACWTADGDSILEMNYTNVTTTMSFAQQHIDYQNLVDPKHFTFCAPRAISASQGLGLALGGYGLSIGNMISGSRQSAFAFSDPTVQEMDYFGVTNDASNDVFTFLSTNGGLRSVMPRLADSLTSLSLTLPNRTESITGSFSSPEVFVAVRWEWMSLPIFLCVCGAIFLAVTAFSSRIAGVGLWKGSSLAYFYHGLEESPVAFESYDTASWMQASAESTRVSLRFSERTGRVCLA